MKTNYSKFSISGEGYIITKKEATYTRTASGKGWKSKPDSIETKIVDGRHYSNYIQSIPFFNNWGDGASCRAEHEYTFAGYLPVHVVTVSPYQEIKKDVWFTFEIQH